MKRRKISGTMAGFFIVILLVAVLLMANALHRTSRIVLPEAAEPAASSAAEPMGEAVVRVEITPETVCDAIATLSRPEQYLRLLTAETLWNGGSGTIQASVAVSGALSRVDLTQTDGRVRHSITDGETTYIWYDTSGQWYTAAAGDVSADAEQHIPTYEDILALSAEQIAAADYRTFSGENCIYVETAPDEYGYTQRYWVSVASGLLAGAERLENGQTIYRMAAWGTTQAAPAPGLFTLPDGTALQGAAEKK